MSQSPSHGDEETGKLPPCPQTKHSSFCDSKRHNREPDSSRKPPDPQPAGSAGELDRQRKTKQSGLKNCVSEINMEHEKK